MSVHVSALINLGSEVNAIHPTFAKKLSVPIKPKDIRVQKSDSITLDTFGMVVAAFSLIDKANQVKFFKEIFLVANVGLEEVFEIFFLTLSGADVNFLGWKLCWRTYTIKETLLTTKGVKLVGKKEFTTTVLDLESKIFVVYVALLSSITLPSSSLFQLDVHSCRRP